MDPATIAQLLDKGFLLTVSPDGTLTFQKPTIPTKVESSPTTDEQSNAKPSNGKLLLESIQTTRCLSPSSDDGRFLTSICEALGRQTSSIPEETGKIDGKLSYKEVAGGSLSPEPSSVAGGSLSPEPSSVAGESLNSKDVFGDRHITDSERFVLEAILIPAGVTYKDKELYVSSKDCNSRTISLKDTRRYCLDKGFCIFTAKQMFASRFNKFNKEILDGRLFLYVNDDLNEVTVNFSKKRVAKYKKDFSLQNVGDLAKCILLVLIFKGKFNQDLFLSYTESDSIYTTNVGILISKKCGYIMSVIKKELINDNSVMIELIDRLKKELDAIFQNILTFEICLGEFDGKDCLSINASVLKKNWKSLCIMEAIIDTDALYSE
jgi:hypothetical protein